MPKILPGSLRHADLDPEMHILILNSRIETDYTSLCEEKIAAYEEDIQDLTSKLDDMAAQYNELIANSKICCAYCGDAYPNVSLPSMTEIIVAHSKTCQKHPKHVSQSPNKVMDILLRKAYLWAISYYLTDGYVTTKDGLNVWHTGGKADPQTFAHYLDEVGISGPFYKMEEINKYENEIIELMIKDDIQSIVVNPLQFTTYPKTPI